jgi:putative peptidoglycan lipid II flippase
MLVSLVTLYGGMLNAVQCFASPAAAPVLLNLSMMAALASAAFFPSAAHAAAWGVLVAGVLEVALVGADAARRTGLPRFAGLALDDDVKRFFKALGPATVGSAGVQIALFADTIIATFLASGAISALYYADRLNQLPIGVIGIAVGTVVLPEMASRLAGGDTAGARDAQARAIELTLLLSVPCLVAFVLVPEAIMAGLFSRGAFTTADAGAAGATLRAYAIGLLPFVLIRSLTATFLARGDTATPVRAMLIAVAVNVALKVALMGPFAQVGLALATSFGAWVNVALVVWFAHRAGLIDLQPRLRSAIVKLAAAGAVLAVALVVGDRLLSDALDGVRTFREEMRLGGLTVVGVVAYVATIAVLFGGTVIAGLRRRKTALAPVPSAQEPPKAD